LLPSIILLWYYNIIIENKMKHQHYTIFKPGEQSQLLITAGFTMLESGQNVYAGQAEMVVGKK